MQKILEELTNIELNDLYNLIEDAVKEVFPYAKLESLDKYHSFINIKDKKGKTIATIHTEGNLLKYGKKDYKSEIRQLSSILQQDLGGSWSYFNAK